MSLKQRTRPMHTSIFLEKFRGKTSVVGKDGLSGLFNCPRPRKIVSSPNSLHRSTNLNKENIQTVNIDHRRLDSYSIEPIDLPKRSVHLPRIKMTAGEPREICSERNKWKAQSQYQKICQQNQRILEQLQIDDYVTNEEPDDLYVHRYPRKFTLEK